MRIILAWIGQLTAAGILLVAAFPKLIGDPSSIAMFEELGMGAFGRYLIGILEILAAALLLVPLAAAYGALLACGIMLGAFIAHLTELGIAGQNGLFALLALGVFTAALVVLFARRTQIPMIKDMFSMEGGAREEEEAERP